MMLLTSLVKPCVTAIAVIGVACLTLSIQAESTGGNGGGTPAAGDVSVVTSTAGVHPSADQNTTNSSSRPFELLGGRQARDVTPPIGQTRPSIVAPGTPSAKPTSHDQVSSRALRLAENTPRLPPQRRTDPSSTVGEQKVEMSYLRERARAYTMMAEAAVEELRALEGAAALRKQAEVTLHRAEATRALGLAAVIERNTSTRPQRESNGQYLPTSPGDVTASRGYSSAEGPSTAGRLRQADAVAERHRLPTTADNLPPSRRHSAGAVKPSGTARFGESAANRVRALPRPGAVDSFADDPLTPVSPDVKNSAVPADPLAPFQTKSIALDRPASASSCEHDSRTAGKAVDGDLGTRWCADGSQADEWLMIDLQNPKQIGLIRVHWEKLNTAYHYRMSGSKDGENFRPLGEYNADFKHVGATVSHSFDKPLEGIRFLKITFLGNSLHAWASIREVEVAEGYQRLEPIGDEVWDKVREDATIQFFK